MAQEIGTAYVTVQPSARGFGKAIEGEVGGGLDGATKKADKGFLGLAKKAAKWGTAAVVATGAAIMGLAAKGGISRALNIEDAQAKLKGLGHDAKSVDQIMVDALASVKGTAYGLDAAATTAASAVAAGIKPGKELEGYLRLTADSATIAGVSMEEMGSIINQVTAKGKVGMENLNRLTERGIPIMQMLADEYGVTSEEMAKMVSKGEVDAERFRKALENGVGGAALASGDTTRGAFANMSAALSRLGLTVVKPFVDNAKSLFNEFTVILDGVNERIGPWADKFSEFFSSKAGPALDGFGERFLGFIDKLTGGESALGGLLTLFSPLGLAIKAIGPAFEEAGGGFDGMAEGIATGLPGIVNSILGIVQQVVPQLLQSLLAAAPQMIQGWLALFSGVVSAVTQILPQVISTVQTMLPQIVNTLVTALPLIIQGALSMFSGIVQALTQIIPVLITTIVTLLPQLVSSIVSMLPMIVQGAIQLFMGLVQALVQVIPMLLTAIVELLPVIATTLLSLLPLLVQAAVQLFTALVQGLTEVLPVLLTAIIALVPVVVETLLSMLPTILQAAIQLFTALVDSLPLILPPLLQAIITLLPSIISTVIGMLPRILQAAVQLFTALVKALPIILPRLLSAIIAMLPSIITSVIGMVPQLLKAAVDLFMALVKSIPQVLPQLISAIVGLGPQLAGAVLGLIPQMVSAGADLLRGLGTGIANAAGEVIAKAKEVGGKILGGVKSFFGIHSPSRVFRDEIGKQLMAGLAIGIGEGREGVRKALNDTNAAILKAQTDAIKKETKRIQEERRVANQKITAYNKKLMKERDAALAKADKISDKKKRAAEKKRINAWYKANKKDTLPTLTAAQAEKQAKANLGIDKTKMAAAKKMISEQKKLTAGLWDDGKYKGAITRWKGFNQGTVKLLTSLAESGKFLAKATKEVKGATLADIGRAQEDVSKAITSAKETLADMQKASAELASSVSNKIQGELDLGSLVGKDGTVTHEKISEFVSGLAARAKTFAGLINDMRAAGIPAGLINEVGMLGSEKGIAVARALLSGSKEQNAALAEDFVSFGSWADKAGQSVADSMYLVGIDAQKGLIKGLEADAKKLEAAAQQIVDTLTKAVKDKLGIKSPSRLFRDQIGAQIVAGLSIGMGKVDPAIKAAKSLASDVVGAFGRPSLNAEVLAGVSVPGSKDKAARAEQRSMFEAFVQAVRSGAFEGTRAGFGGQVSKFASAAAAN